MDKRRFAFDKSNYILLIAGVAVIIAGFVLMLGPGSTMTHFEPDIFSFRRIKLAPAVCFTGFIFIIYAIMHKPAAKRQDKTQE
ncbi:MAG: DUF3098 domain-containing protein [Bacteroidaceae bacterium]|nr:DUF3098 domain-containing protein [Bacteroidaceae bacterium]MBQ3538790.1 DUF3098 domain-containing protein [Bacteroidaceae bacterium]MBQ6693936.1 DUF3098 domain-containing protein [Bacteroidaceae bacterium]MBR7166737.1 DUF3098 domain-containing protein [Bacteroidaceae bacterium]